MKRARATLTIDFNCGVDISDAAQEARRLAVRLDVVVKFDFNQVECIFFPGDNPSIMVENYRRELNRTDKVARIAFSSPKR